MINLNTDRQDILIRRDIEDAEVNASISRIMDHVQAHNAGVLYDLTAITHKQLTLWAKGTDVQIDGDVAALAQTAADAIPVGCVDVLVLIAGQVRALSVTTRVGPDGRGIQVAAGDRALLTCQSSAPFNGTRDGTPWTASLDAGSADASELEAVRLVLGCLALVAEKALALHKVADAVADGRTWLRFPRISKRYRLLKPHYRRAHWRKVHERLIFVRATIVHADRLDVSIGADIACAGVLYMPMPERTRRVLIEDRMLPSRTFGMVGQDVTKLAEHTRIAYDRPIFSYMRALMLQLAELADHERLAPRGKALISLDRALRVLNHRLLPSAAE